MRKDRLGTTGPEITRLGFGAWALGGPSKGGWGEADDEESVAAIRHAVESGVNWVDTAAFYGRGHSEEVVGKALAPWKGSGDIYVFTKCGLRWDPGDPEGDPTNNLTPESIRHEIDESLRRLNLDRIDLYQFHWPDELGTPVEESWSTMAELVDEGKVRWIGVSNFGIDLLERCQAIRRVDSLQPPLNLIDRRARDVLIPWCRENGVGVIVYSPMASGLLTGAYDRARCEALPANDWRRGAPHFQEPELSKNLALISELEVIAARLGTTLPALAVAWTLAVPGVNGAIVGARRATQVDGWLPAGNLELGQDVLDDVERAIQTTQTSAASPIESESPKAREGIT